MLSASTPQVRDRVLHVGIVGEHTHAEARRHARETGADAPQPDQAGGLPGEIGCEPAPLGPGPAVAAQGPFYCLVILRERHHQRERALRDGLLGVFGDVHHGYAPLARGRKVDRIDADTVLDDSLELWQLSITRSVMACSTGAGRFPTSSIAFFPDVFMQEYQPCPQPRARRRPVARSRVVRNYPSRRSSEASPALCARHVY